MSRFRPKIYKLIVIIIALCIGLVIGFVLEDQLNWIGGEDEELKGELISGAEQIEFENTSLVEDYDRSEIEDDGYNSRKEKLVENEGEMKDWNEYENNKFGYYLKYPNGWYSDPENDPEYFAAFFTNYNPEEVNGVEEVPGIKLEVLVQQNITNSTLQGWVDEGHAFLGEPISSEKIEVDGIEAIKEEISIDQGGLKSGDGSGDKMISVYLLIDNQVFSIAMYGLEEQYEDNKENFDKVISSMLIKK